MIIISFGAHHIPFVYTLAASHRAPPSLALVHSFVRSFIHSFIPSFIHSSTRIRRVLDRFFIFSFRCFFRRRRGILDSHTMFSSHWLCSTTTTRKTIIIIIIIIKSRPAPFLYPVNNKSIKQQTSLSQFSSFLPHFFSSCNSTTFSSLRMGGSINRRKATTAVSPSRSFSVDVLRREQKN